MIFMGNKKLKAFILFLLAAVFLLLLSPIISLCLPEKLRHHIYQRIIFNAIVDKEAKGCTTDEEKAFALFNYVVKNEVARGVPYKCKPLDSLIFREAYCDFQARTLNLLLAVAGIASRYAMLLDENGISPHTINEVLLGNKWRLFDTTNNYIFRDNNGNLVSLNELFNNPQYVYTAEKTALKASRKDFVALYEKILSVRKEPRRSTACIYQSHVFDAISDIYFRIFKYSFLNFYQDVYLSINKKHAQPEDSRLFYNARNYHLAYRFSLASQIYDTLLREYPESRYREDIVFFNSQLRER